jgi:nicotinamidase-related amidase
MGVDTIIVTGMTTSGSVRATVVDGFSYDFRVVVPKECVADISKRSHLVNLFDMDMKYADVMPLASLLARMSSHLSQPRLLAS